MRVRVIQEGKEAGQGVGFLDDGTMIVVEGGARHIDRELDVVGHPRAADRRRPDDLRPAAPRLSGPRRGSRRPGIADAIVVAAGALGADGRHRQAAGRARRSPAARLDARRAARRRPRSSRIVVVTRRGRRAERWRGADWLPGRVVDVVAGGARRQESVAAGFVAFDRHGAGRPAGRPRPRRRPAAASARARVARVAARPPSTARRSRSCRSPRRSSGSTASRSSATVDRTGLGAAQTPQGVRRDLLRAAYAASRRRRRRRGPTRPRCSRPVASRSMSSPATRQPQGDRCPPTSRARRRALARPRPRAADGHRPGQATRSGRARRCVLGGIAIAGAPAAVRPLRR